jgi:transcriptional regulator with GAF, ATPase, and Fis domain
MHEFENRIRFFCSIGLMGSLVLLVGGYVAVFQFQDSIWPGFPLRTNGAVALKIFAAPEVVENLQGLEVGMRVTHVNGIATVTGAEVYKIVAAMSPGTVVRYTMENVITAERKVFLVPAQRFTQAIAYRVWMPFLGVGLIFMGTLCLPVFVRTDSPSSRALYMVGIGVANQYCFALPILYFAYRYDWATQFFGLPTMAGILILALVFPVARPPMRKYPRMSIGTIWLVTVAFVLAEVVWMRTQSPYFFWMEFLRMRLLLLGFIVLFCNVAYTAFRHGNSGVRAQARLFLRGLVLGGLTMCGLQVFSRYAGEQFDYLEPLVWANPLLIFSSSISIGMLRYGLFGFGREARRSLGRLSLFLVTLSFGFIGFAFLEIFLDTAQAWGIMFAASLIVIATLAIWPRAYQSLEGLLEAVLIPERQRSRVTLEAAAVEMSGIQDSEKIAEYMERVLSVALRASWVRCVTGSPGQALVAIPARAGALSIEPGTQLYQLILSGSSLVTQPAAAPGGALSRAVLEARREDISLLAAMPVREDFVGALLCGPPEQGAPYTASDFSLVKLLATSVAVALENARSWKEVHELRARLEQENLFLRSEARSDLEPSELIGTSALLLDALGQIEAVAATSASVLVVGETGVGKELAVRQLHQSSLRADQSLVKVACAALPESLLESELFGFEKGAFTGATQRRIGRFEVADRGTLFLDDVDTLPLPVQAKLLRAIQEGEIQRLGSNEVRQVDVRLVAATNRDLLGEVQAGRFREDLYYRLNVVPIQLPALRERKGDIAALVAHFANTLGPALGREIEEISAASLETLQNYDWPGNIRELRNTVERALVMGRGPVLQLWLGPLSSPGDSPPMSPSVRKVDSDVEGRVGSASLKELLLEHKKGLILEALTTNQGNQAAAAKTLGVHRSNLNRMIKDLKVSMP